MTETKDPFQRIREYAVETQESVKKTIDRLITSKIQESAKKEAFLAELRGCSEECQAILNDKRYSRQVQFLSELRNAYSRSLERANAASTAEIAKIQGKIECLDTVLNRPKQAIKEYEKIQKELNK